MVVLNIGQARSLIDPTASLTRFHLWLSPHLDLLASVCSVIVDYLPYLRTNRIRRYIHFHEKIFPKCNKIRGATQNFTEVDYSTQTKAGAHLVVICVRVATCTCVSAIFQMADIEEQQICIKFCFKLKKTAAETCAC